MTLTAGRVFSYGMQPGSFLSPLPFFTLFIFFFTITDNLGLVGPCASPSTSSRVAGARTNREIVLNEAQGVKAQYRCAAAQIL